MDPIQEHDRIDGVFQQTERFEHLSLVSWKKPREVDPWGYYASYVIGAEWIDEHESLVVTTKRKMENIDFLGMFMTCFSSNLSVESFSEIYSIHADQPSINAPSLKGVVSPLIVLHFLGVVSRIKTLKKGYVHHSENLKKVKGRIQILKNERTNVAMKRYDRIYCEFDEYSVDIPENRLLKKALLFSQQMLSGMKSHHSYNTIHQKLAKSLALFENVGSEVEIKDIKLIKSHKLYKEYAEAIRLAKQVLAHFDYSINKTTESSNKVVPFVLDMSLLYEHYVYGLLYEAYHEKIVYQYVGFRKTKPDFLYCSEDFRAILDTKYIPRYDVDLLDVDVMRQLSGYGRDLRILKRLGYNDITIESPTPSVPCVIIYPTESPIAGNPFSGKALKGLCTNRVPELSQFYKISIPLPVIGK
jgi:5-methylcytosine-specific restriction enzyme subunit McrC